MSVVIVIIVVVIVVNVVHVAGGFGYVVEWGFGGGGANPPHHKIREEY